MLRNALTALVLIALLALLMGGHTSSGPPGWEKDATFEELRIGGTVKNKFTGAKVVEVSGNWFKIKYGDSESWINSENVVLYRLKGN